MAIVVESISVSTPVAGSSASVNLPSGVANGDVLVAIVSHGRGHIDLDTNAAFVDSGLGEVDSGATDQPCFRVQTRVVTDAGSEPASYSWSTGTGANTTWALALLRVSGVDTADVLAGAPASAGPTTNAAPVSPAMTTDEDNALVIRVAVGDGSIEAALPTGDTGYPTSHTGHFHRLNTAGNIANQVICGAASAIQASAGSTGTATWAYEASALWITATIALKPAAVAGGGGQPSGLALLGVGT